MYNIPTVPSMFMLGAATPTPTTAAQSIADIAVESPTIAALAVIHGLFRFAGAGIAGVHGYRRNNGSVGAAVGWGVLGFVFPIITTVVSLAQGYSTPKK